MPGRDYKANQRIWGNNLKSNQGLSNAIVAILSAHAVAAYADAPGKTPSASNEIAEITVTRTATHGEYAGRTHCAAGADR